MCRSFAVKGLVVEDHWNSHRTIDQGSCAKLGKPWLLLNVSLSPLERSSLSWHQVFCRCCRSFWQGLVTFKIPRGLIETTEVRVEAVWAFRSAFHPLYFYAFAASFSFFLRHGEEEGEIVPHSPRLKKLLRSLCHSHWISRNKISPLDSCALVVQPDTRKLETVWPLDMVHLRWNHFSPKVRVERTLAWSWSREVASCSNSFHAFQFSRWFKLGDTFCSRTGQALTSVGASESHVQAGGEESRQNSVQSGQEQETLGQDLWGRCWQIIS